MLGNIIILIQIAALTLSFFLMVIIINRADKQNYSNKLLLLFLSMKSYGLFLFIILKIGLFNELWFLYRTGLPTSLFLPALGYLYLKSILNDEEKFKKTDLIHLTPLVIGLIQYLPYYLAESTFKKQIVKNLGDLSEEYSLKLGFLPENEFTFIRGLIFLIYAILIMVLVFQKVLRKNQGTHPIQKLDIKVLRWVKTFGISFSLSCLMVFSYFYLQVAQNAGAETSLITLLGIGVAVFFNGSLIYYSSYLILNPETLIGLYKRNDTISQKNNPVTQAENFKAILIQIERELKINKLYKQADVNIEKLALKINQPTRLTSYVINNCFEMNFNQLINSHRIEEAIQKLENNYLKEFTIDALWSEIGFSNRTSFYKKFKETTKMTPFEYAKLNQSDTNLNLVSQK